MMSVCASASPRSWFTYCSASWSEIASSPPSTSSASGDAAQRGSGGTGQRPDFRGPSFGLVDAALFLTLAAVDRLLHLTAGLVDRRLHLRQAAGDLGTFLAFGTQLCFHRHENIVRNLDVLDLVARDIHAPLLAGLVHRLDDRSVDRVAFLKRFVQLQLADHRPHRGLRQLDRADFVVGDAVACLHRIDNAEVQHPVHVDLHVVPREARLARYIDRLLFEAVLIRYLVDKRYQQVKAGFQGAGVLTETLHHQNLFCRHDTNAPQDRYHHDQAENTDRDLCHELSDHCAPPCVRLSVLLIPIASTRLRSPAKLSGRTEVRLLAMISPKVSINCCAICIATAVRPFGS